MRESEVRIDPYTQEEFFPKRSNQIFATPQNKMMFHNERAKEYRDETKEFRNCYDRCYKILRLLLEGKSPVRVHHEYLEGMGFDYVGITAYHETKEGFVFYVYDIVVVSDDDDYYIIYRTEDDKNGYLV